MASFLGMASKFKAATKIQSLWKCYKIKVLIKRYKMVRYLKDFRIWNPTIQIFLLRLESFEFDLSFVIWGSPSHDK